MSKQPAKFPKLFEPIRIGPLELKNRIVMPAMHLNFTPEGFVTDRMVEFYKERARGGVAMVIVGASRITEDAGAFMMLNAYSEEALPGLTRLCKAIQAGGSLACLQIFHAGAYVHAMLSGGNQSVSASEHVSGFTGETARELKVAEIRELIDRFGKAAELAVRAGYDAVEILGAAGYLPCQFISPKTNRRDDEYGGTEEKRMRFGLEAADAVRQAVGSDRALWFRLAGNEFVPGGNTNKQTRNFARALAGRGVDAFNITGGWHETRVPQLTVQVPPGGYVYLAQGVRMEAGKPTMACNRINDPAQAERILTEWSVDLVGMGRALIADPELPNKAGEGRPEAIIHCLACNQGCFDPVFRMESSCCMINPTAGREVDLLEQGAAGRTDRGAFELTRAAEKRRVAVVGAGPAGLAAAWAAALRGHDVTVYERDPEVGGQLRLAAAMRDRGGFLQMAHDLAAAAERAGARLELGVEDTVAKVKASRADVAVLATGARPAEPPFPVDPQAHAVDSWEVLAGKVVCGRRVAVVGAGATGCETALELARHGSLDAETVRFLLSYSAESPEEIRELALKGPREITLVEMARKPARDVGKSTRWVLLQDLKRAGVKVMTDTVVKRVVPEGVEVERGAAKKKDADAQAGVQLIECDTVVLAAGVVPNRELEASLNGLGIEVKLAGDVVEPARALEAVRAGFDVGISI